MDGSKQNNVTTSATIMNRKVQIKKNISLKKNLDFSVLRSMQ